MTVEPDPSSNEYAATRADWRRRRPGPRRCRRNTRIRAHLAARVPRPHPIRITRRRHQTRIRQRRRRGRRHLHEPRTTSALTPLHLVRRHTQIVRRRRPRQIHPTRPRRRRRQPRRCRRRIVHRHRRHRRRHTRIRPRVPRRVPRTHPIAVRRPRRPTRITPRQCRHRRHRRKARTPRTLTPLHLVPRHTNVVRRRRPRQINPARAHRTRHQPRHLRRHRRIRRPTQRRRHIRLNLRLRQRHPIHPHLIDTAREVLPVRAVAADPQRVGGRRDVARHRRARRLHPVHEQPQRRPVIGHRKMRPRTHRQRSRPECVRDGSVHRHPSGRSQVPDMTAG